MLFIEKTKSWSKTKRILLYAYSMWFGAYLPLLILIVPEVLYGFFQIETSPLLWWVLALISATLVPFVRPLKQRKTLPDVD